ncbi:MAG: UTP--glucose-1-phosphate uridylyltransferase GalU [Methanobacteriota archaeon]
MKAVIPAAGLGTRFLPATKSMPKEMLPILDKPVIQYVVEEAVASGIDDILIVTGRGKRAIEDHFDHSVELEARLSAQGRKDEVRRVREISEMATIHYIRQPEPRGLGDAVLRARKFAGGEQFAVLLGDDILIDSSPATRQLVDVVRETDGSAVTVLRVPRDRVSNYGIVSGRAVPGRAGLHRVDTLVEKPAPAAAPSDLAIMGRYVFGPEIFDYLAKTDPGHGGEVQLTDAMAAMARAHPMFACEFRGTRLDVGSIFGFLEANLQFALGRPDLAPDVRTLLRRLSA